ncbi:MAG TPA: DUF962 domain-containing protein [Saprospiraceae bacterium]|nr:DUF962 domain-containing protein [Saprospiraceae bacterium]
MEKRYNTLKTFYPYYLLEHSNATTRQLHYIGTSLFILIMLYGLLTAHWGILIWAPLAGYGFAWFGHFFFEKNRPATFKYPLYSLVSDFIMLYHFFTGQISERIQAARSSL